MKSGNLAVFASPAMLALMEEASCSAISPVLDEGETTVGTAFDIKHISPTPVRLRVTAKAEITQCSDREVFSPRPLSRFLSHLLQCPNSTAMSQMSSLLLNIFTGATTGDICCYSSRHDWHFDRPGSSHSTMSAWLAKIGMDKFNREPV